MKKGISLVALIITIIVLIILTAAVILTGGDTPGTAKKAVFLSDASSIQDAVTLFKLNDMAEKAGTGEAETAIADTADTASKVTVDTVDYYDFSVTAAQLNLSGTDLSKWRVSADGLVILATGATDGTDTWYNAGVVKTGTVVSGAVSFAAYQK